MSSASVLYREVVFDSVMEHIDTSVPIMQRAAIWLLNDARALLALGQEPFVLVLEKVQAALQLRAMNIIYETTKERGATILIPTAMIDAMNPGGLLGLTQMAQAAQAAPQAAPAAKASR